MPILEWSSTFLTGVSEFDDHHKHLVGLINRTYDEYSSNPSAGNLEGIITELADYAVYHFETEERWMKEQSYPEYSRHKEEHEKFAGRIAEFQKDASTGRLTSSSLFFFLTEWLTTHILETDAEYGRFIAASTA